MSAVSPRWRSRSRWPGWQGARWLFLSSFFVEGYSPRAPETTAQKRKSVSQIRNENNPSNHAWVKSRSRCRLPWWLGGKESACEGRRRKGRGLDPCSGKIPHASEQLSPCNTATEPVLQGPGATTTEPTRRDSCSLTPRESILCTRVAAAEEHVYWNWGAVLTLGT